MSNAWHEFRRAHKGMGYTLQELSHMYQQQKASTSPSPSYTSKTSVASQREFSTPIVSTRRREKETPKPVNAWNEFQQRVAGLHLSSTERSKLYKAEKAAKAAGYRTETIVPPYNPKQVLNSAQRNLDFADRGAINDYSGSRFVPSGDFCAQQRMDKSTNSWRPSERSDRGTAYPRKVESYWRAEEAYDFVPSENVRTQQRVDSSNSSWKGSERSNIGTAYPRKPDSYWRAGEECKTTQASCRNPVLDKGYYAKQDTFSFTTSCSKAPQCVPVKVEEEFLALATTESRLPERLVYSEISKTLDEKKENRNEKEEELSFHKFVADHEGLDLTDAQLRKLYVNVLETQEEEKRRSQQREAEASGIGGQVSPEQLKEKVHENGDHRDGAHHNVVKEEKREIHQKPSSNKISSKEKHLATLERISSSQASQKLEVKSLPESLRIPLKDITFDQSSATDMSSRYLEIARGSFGSVVSATWKGMKVAVKILHDQIKSQKDMRKFKHELEIIGSCVHPNIVRYFGYVLLNEDELNTVGVQTLSKYPKVGLVMELLSGGDVTNVLYGREHGMSIAEKQRVVHSMAKGLEYIHVQKGLAHRDIKLANFLVDRDASCAKLCDFGLALFRARAATKSTAVFSIAGTISFMAPEIFKGILSTDNVSGWQKADMYALSLAVLEVLAEEEPWEEEVAEVIRAKVLNDERPTKLVDALQSAVGDLADILKDTIQSCWDPDPSKRPSITEFVNTLEAAWPLPETQERRGRTECNVKTEPTDTSIHSVYSVKREESLTSVRTNAMNSTSMLDVSFISDVSATRD